MLDRFWIAPALTAAVLALSYGVGFLFYGNALTVFTADWNALDWTTCACYLALFFSLFRHRGDYATKTEKRNFALFCFFALSAFLREAGIQHWLASSDTTAFKIKFFTNPDNPLFEKVASALCLTAVGAAFVYTMFLYLSPAFRGLFKKYAGSWTIVTLLGCGALCKITDRIPSNLRKAGFFLPKDGLAQGIIETAEETLETMLPVLAILALAQFHKNKGLFFPPAKRVTEPPRSES